MSRGAYFGEGYAGNYNREHLIVSQEDKNAEIAQNIAEIMSSYDTRYGDAARSAIGVTDYNSARMLANADHAYELSQLSAHTAMEHSAAEAAANRDWQERLSDTAHQREVQDLIAAGLNPVLSANQGAYTGAGAVGQGFSSSAQAAGVDNAGSAIIGSLFNTLINNAANEKLTAMNNAAQAYSADKNLAASQAIAGGNVAAAQIAQQGALLRQENELNFNQKENILNRTSNEAIASGYNSASRYSADTAAAASRYQTDEKHFDTIPGAVRQTAIGVESILNHIGDVLRK